MSDPNPIEVIHEFVDAYLTPYNTHNDAVTEVRDELLAYIAKRGLVIRPAVDDDTRRRAKQIVDTVERIGYATTLERAAADLIAKVVLGEATDGE